MSGRNEWDLSGSSSDQHNTKIDVRPLWLLCRCCFFTSIWISFWLCSCGRLFVLHWNDKSFFANVIQCHADTLTHPDTHKFTSKICFDVNFSARRHYVFYRSLHSKHNFAIEIKYEINIGQNNFPSATLLCIFAFVVCCTFGWHRRDGCMLLL